MFDSVSYHLPPSLTCTANGETLKAAPPDGKKVHREWGVDVIFADF